MHYISWNNEYLKAGFCVSQDSAHFKHLSLSQMCFFFFVSGGKIFPKTPQCEIWIDSQEAQMLNTAFLAFRSQPGSPSATTLTDSNWLHTCTVHLTVGLMQGCCVERDHHISYAAGMMDEGGGVGSGWYYMDKKKNSRQVTAECWGVTFDEV